MPTVTIHYLGILPISLGIWEFLKVVRSSHGESAALAVQSVEDRAWQRAIAIGLVTIASGGDSLVVFTSLFADTRYSADFVILATAAGMAILWVVLAQGLLGFPWLVRHLNRLGGYLLPFLLICVGVFILMDTPVDTM
jgi:cadmium resistance protein CadD (predicted permease)